MSLTWESMAIEKLLCGETVQMRVSGNSMTGKIESGSTVVIEPVKQGEAVETGDIVLCRVHGGVYLHIVTAARNGDSFQISNNHGHVNGWTSRSKIYGKYVRTAK